MRRRSGFTLVEVLVAMALILFILTILAASFGAATQTVSDLKSAGDLAERLRGACTVIHRDLEADHFQDAKHIIQPLSKIWDTTSNPNPPPPDQGFLRIYEGSPAIVEGTDINGLPSYRQTTAALAYTIALTGTRRNDFLSAFVGAGSPLVNPADPALGPTDQRYEDTPNTGAPQVYNSQSAEVALFLVPTPDVTDASAPGGAQPLYGLYRRQLLTVPGPWGAPSWNNAAVGVAQAPNYIEVSTVPTAGETPAAANLTFNGLKDLTYPPERFWMNRTNLAGIYQALPPPAPPNTYRYPAMGDVNASYQAADLLMPDVLSMDVRVLVQAPYSSAGAVPTSSDFEDLYDLTNPNRKIPGTNTVWYFPYNNPYTTDPSTGQTVRVFDTWAADKDSNNPTYDYSNLSWMPQQVGGQPGSPKTIPIYQDNLSTALKINPISILAIQITLRVWDFKTKKTRQVTIVQQM